MTEVGRDAIAGRDIFPPRRPPCSAATTSATTTGTASGTCCPARPGGHGGVGNDTRLFVDAIRYLAKTGIAWADLPTCFGKPNSLWQRYNRWCRTGVWARVAAALRDDDTEWLSVDSTLRPRHRGGRRREKKADGTGGQSAEALGRSRGGFGTKIHARREPAGPPGGAEADRVRGGGQPAAAGPDRRASRPTRCWPTRGTTRTPTGRRSGGRGPSRASRRGRTGRSRSTYDRHLYQERNVVERFFGRIKQYRRVATRYDKKAANFLGFVWVASIDIMLA